jgi:hypothetical protein
MNIAVYAGIYDKSRQKEPEVDSFALVDNKLLG